MTQLFEVLDPATLAGLRESIRRLGVLVPIAKDQHGNVLDGHHRIKVADELGMKYRVDTIQVVDEQQADEVRRTLNVDRRQLTGDDLKRHILVLAQLRRPDGVGALSQNEIADRSGVSQYVGQVFRDPQVRSTSNLPGHRQGTDGIDLDGVEYCSQRGCNKPLLLVETALDRGQSFKGTAVLQRLAQCSNTTAVCVLYRPSSGSPDIICPCTRNDINPDCDHGIDRFRVKRVWPDPHAKFNIITPEQYVDRIRDIRLAHLAAEHATWGEESG